MPKVVCTCGFVHDLSPIPDGGWITVRDKDYEALIEAESAVANGDKDRVRQMVAFTGRLYECPECGRLLWSKPGDSCENFANYLPDRRG
jgi:hypothetical protein